MAQHSGKKNKLEEIESRKQIQEREKVLDSIFNNAPNILMLVNSSGKVEKINHKGVEHSGRDEAELMGLLAGQVINCVNSFGKSGCGHNEECVDCPVRTRFEETLQTGITHDHQEVQMSLIRNEEKHTLDLLISTTLIDLNSDKQVLVSLTDITKLKETEKSLESSREQYALVVKASRDGIWDRDLRDNSLYLSPRWKEILGYEDYELPNDFSTFEDLLHPDDKSRVLNNIKDYLDDQIPAYSIEFRLQHKNGSYRWILARGEVLRDENNVPYRMAGSHTDITERRQAEIALRESEEKFRTIVENLLDGMFICDFKGKIIDVNEIACKMVGYSRSELTGMNLSNFFPPEIFTLFLGYLEQLLIKDRLLFESEAIKKGGSSLPIEVSAKVVTHAENGLIQAFARDITHRKETETQLRFQAKLLDSVEQSVIVTDRKGRILYWNPYSEKLYGWQESEALGKNIAEVNVPQLNRDQLNGLMSNLYEGKSWSAELPVQGKDGKKLTIFVINSPIFDENDKLDAIIGIATDITERKKNEEELDRVKKSLDEAQRIANVGSWELDMLTGEMWWSDGLYRLWARDKSDGPLDLDNIRNHIHPDDIDRVEKAIENSLKRGKYVTDYRFIRPVDNEILQIHAEGEIFYDDKGEPLKHSGVIRDVTRQKNLEAQLRQAQKMESIGTLAGGIAHDFNNILSPIMLHTEMAMDELPPDDPLQYGMKEVFKAGERARDLVKQILTLARKEPEEKVSLKSSIVVKEGIKFLRSTIPTTIDIRYHNEARQDTILADPAKLNQIVMNLCTNAAYAMKKDGGELEVVLDNEDISTQKAGGFINLEPGRYLKITVRDTGTGISPGIINRIFEPYFTTKNVGEGTGLGLAIIHGIVQNWGGDIEVESDIGKGSSFHVYLPLTHEELPGTDEQETELQKGNEQILFVDDESQIVDAMQRILKRLGYKVTPMTKSMEALEVFSSNPDAFDVIITDMTMPNMTGEELAKEFKSLRPDIPIILCTGYSDKINEYEAKRIGIDAYIMKPVTLSEMAKAVREVLDN